MKQVLHLHSEYVICDDSDPICHPLIPQQFQCVGFSRKESFLLKPLTAALAFPDRPSDCSGPPLEVNKYIQRLIGMKLLETVDWRGSERSALLLQYRYLALKQGTSGTNYGAVRCVLLSPQRAAFNWVKSMGYVCSRHYESISLAQLPAILALLTIYLAPFLKNLHCEDQNTLHLLRLKLCLKCLYTLRHEGSPSPPAAGTKIGSSCKKKFSPTSTLALFSSNNTGFLPFSLWFTGLDQNPNLHTSSSSLCHRCWLCQWEGF